MRTVYVLSYDWVAWHAQESCSLPQARAAAGESELEATNRRDEADCRLRRSQLDQWAVATERPLYVTVRAAAFALSVAPKTLRSWLATGRLVGIRPHCCPPWHDRQPAGGQGRWRVSVASIEALLARAGVGERELAMVVRRRLRKLGKPAPPRAPG